MKISAGLRGIFLVLLSASQYQASNEPQCLGLTEGEVLPKPIPAFDGHIGMRTSESKPSWPQADPVAPADSPNVLHIVLDDVGFGASSAFGGPIATPNFEKLAARGLKYTRFHTTALCSPTRAAMLTGRNHHSVHTGTIMETATGYPGYDTLMGADTATVAEVLKQNGWSTAWFGKNHNVPDWQSSQAGPFMRWPNALGFERFYGFVGGDTSQYAPALFDQITPIEPYLGNPDYTLNEDLANQTIRYIQQQKALAPDVPFFIHYAPGATHAPHHVPQQWSDRYKGKFDKGWDAVRQETFERQKQLGLIPPKSKLTARLQSIPAWEDGTTEDKRLFARMMEVYAGFMEQTDYEIGRVLDSLKEQGLEDNTLVILNIGDNGASAEGSLRGLYNEMSFFNGLAENQTRNLELMGELGGPLHYNHYPVGWAHAMNTPYQWAKQIASHYGGTRNPMIISYPKLIPKEQQGGIRTQWHHAIDLVPTIYEVSGVTQPVMVNGVPQRPIEGVSMAYTFADASVEGTRTVQYFEMLGNQGLFKDGWTAGTTPVNVPWVGAESNVDPVSGVQWELYKEDDDPTQAHDVAKENATQLEAMRQAFTAEASKYNVFPIDNSKIARLDVGARPSLTRGRKDFAYYQHMKRIPEGAAPDLKNKDFEIRADITVPQGGGKGVLVTHGGRYSGYGLYLRDDGRLVYHYNLAQSHRYEVVSKDKLAAGDHTVGVKFKYDGGRSPGAGGTATLLVDGMEVDRGRIDRTLGFRIALDETFDVGQDTGTPVSEEYEVPFAYNGVIRALHVHI